MEGMEKLESDFFIQLLAVKTQWGQYSASASTTRTITLPISFSSIIFFSTHVMSNDGGNGWLGRAYTTSSLSQIKCAVDNWEISANPTCAHYWLCAGK